MQPCSGALATPKELPLNGHKGLRGGHEVPISLNVKYRPSAFNWEPWVPPLSPA